MALAALHAQYQSDEDDNHQPNQSPDAVATTEPTSTISRKRKHRTPQEQAEREMKKAAKRTKRPPPDLASNHTSALSLDALTPPAPSAVSAAAALTSSLLHGGRIRGFAHVEGNWPCHIFIPVWMESLEQYDACVGRGMDQRVNEGSSSASSTSMWHRFLASTSPSTATGVSASASSSLHISLSRTFVLRDIQLASFQTQLGEVVQEFVKQERARSDYQKNKSNAHEVLLRASKVYENDEKTRRFLALLVYPTGEMPHDSQLSLAVAIPSSASPPSASSDLSSFTRTHAFLLRLLHRVNRLVVEWGAPTYYEPPELHITVAWQLHPNVIDKRNLSNQSDLSLPPSSNMTIADSTPSQQNTTAAPVSCVARFTHLQCTIGKKQHSFPLV